MSAVIAEPAAGAAPPPRGKKKLLVIGAAVLAVVLLLTAGGIFLLRQRAAHAAAMAAEDETSTTEAHAAKASPKIAPSYLPLDPFVVNLADRDVDRYAQIGITLELENGASGEQLKAYMPAVRNAILMVLANKTSRDLLDRAGKEQLAQEIMREAVRPMGIDVALPEPVGTLAAMKPASASAASAVAASASGAPVIVAGGDDLAVPKAKPRPRRETQRNPIQQVHFSSFIIQ